MGKLSRWIAGIGAAFKKPAEFFSRPASPPSSIPEETGAESAVAEDNATATVEVENKAPATAEVEVGHATEADVASTIPPAEVEVGHATEADVASTIPPAEVEVGHATEAHVTSTVPPDQQEIQRRRELVRALFNDFWNGSDDKPATFVDRLNRAETHLNAQLAARGEPWQLDANTRKMLGLPPRAH
jgi:hypothetical protein